MANNPYDINYDDERFTQVQDAKQEALTEVENTYGSMIGETDKYYQAQIDASKEWATTQQQLQQENTDFTIEQIEQQKDKANKDYLKEQSGAYVDWQKQSNKYGVNAEQMATGGLENTGFSESSQVSMYNTYQNRVATARASYDLAVQNYNNSIKDAQLQNNSKLAEIAYQALQQQLELSLQGFQYKNQLLLEQANKKQEIDNTYYARYQDVLNQMNTENAMAEEIRQYNENLALQKQQLQEEIRQYEQSYALKVKEFDEQIRQFDTEMARLKKKDAEEHAMELKQLELQKKQVEQAKINADREYQLQKDAYEQQKASVKSSGGGISAVGNATSLVSGNTGGGDKYSKLSQSVKADAKKYGTFDNGYQPKGIAGYGAVTKSGKKVEVALSSGKTQNQNVWVTKDGTMWYWDGNALQYKVLQKGGSVSGSYYEQYKNFLNSI